MSLAIQKGFWQEKIIADTKRKLSELYSEKPQIADSDKRACLEFWQNYEGLADVLGEKLPSFISWFYSATSSATITRCLRGMKQDGTIPLTPEKQNYRQENAQNWRQYWSNGRFH